jgi:hypothetical protein
MKRFRMHKQKVFKPDGRWMYLYTFEEEPSVEEGNSAAEREDSSAALRKRQSTEVQY